MLGSNTTMVKDYFLHLQKIIREALEIADDRNIFVQDAWERTSRVGKDGCDFVTNVPTSHGLTCALTDGKYIEKAGVNFSHVLGETLPEAATAKRVELAGAPFTALGISVIVHPRNPYAPTAHFNLRFFLSEKEGRAPIWWFGGGFDLTPYYGFVEDCVHWHQTAKIACAPLGEPAYEKFKKWADDYFYIKHRKEHRGIGGLFFDDLNEGGFEKNFEFVKNVGDHFLLAYLPILEKRKTQEYTKKQRDFQCYRRGRYVEFNLVYDRGTLFGLQFGGRTESILISLPPEVHWTYDWHPQVGSEEEKLYTEFLVPRDWVKD